MKFVYTIYITKRQKHNDTFFKSDQVGLNVE